MREGKGEEENLCIVHNICMSEGGKAAAAALVFFLFGLAPPNSGFPIYQKSRFQTTTMNAHAQGRLSENNVYACLNSFKCSCFYPAVKKPSL